jgi:hypothetical protein
VSDGSKTDSQTLTVNVTDVNEATPVINSNGGGDTATVILTEGTTLVTDVDATDADTKQTLTYSISGKDAGDFKINASTGVLEFVAAPNFETPADSDGDNSYEVIVQVSDGSKTDSQTLTVNVTDVNEATPVINSNGGGDTATVILTEGTTLVTDVDATDADTKQTLTYSISGGKDAGDFKINAGTGVLEFVAAPNFEAPADSDGDNSYEVIVEVSDGSKTDSQTLTVNVTDVNEAAPVINSNGGGSAATVILTEGTTLVTDVDATDADTKQTLTYSISGGKDAADFKINASTGVLEFVATPDFEAPADSNGDNSYEVIVQVSDGSKTDSQTLTVNVTDVNEAPDVVTTALSLNENTTLAGTILATDPENDKLTYSISGGVDKTLFLIDPDTGALSFKVAPDFEAPTDDDKNGIYNVEIQVTDGEFTDKQTIAVTVDDVNPENVTGNASANSFTGGAGNDTLSGLAGNDTLIGGGGNDSLIGGNDDDSLSGGANDDTLVGGAGNDHLDGSSGTDDLVDYQTAAGVTVDLSANATTVDGNGGQDTLTGIENVRGSTLGADNITGDGSKNVLEGFGGDDLLAGGANDDTLVGGDDNDTLVGGAGADTLTGGLGNDLLDYDSIADAGDTATDFETGAGNDAINIADILAGYGGDGSDLDDLGFVELVGDAAATTIRVDANGNGDGYVDLVTLDGVDVGTVSVDTLVTDGNLIAV